MDEAALNVYDMEEASSATESSDEETRTKLNAFPTPKVSTAWKGAASDRME